ncbi:MAG: response regulator [Desulfomonilaceae bacterium]|jgi:DNA-binding response OmpR family regulator
MKDWKVLLVDDEEEFVVTLAERLRMRGIQAETELDGAAALNKLETYTPQVVVLDLMMPGMTGLTVLERIKQLYPKMEVILLTGIGSTSEGVAGMRLGAFDYLMKPLQIEELIEKIGLAVNRNLRTP